MSEPTAPSSPPIDADPPTRRPVALSLLILAGPIIASMISRTVMNFADFVMVSQLGTQAQAAIMPAAMVVFVLLSVGMGTLSAVATYASQNEGADRKTECSAYGWQGTWLSLIYGLLLAPLWLAMPVLFEWIGHEPAVRAMEIDYARIGVLSIAPTLVALAVSNFFNGIHRPMVGFWAGLIANAFNVLGNFALIYGMWGFPAMGVAGAAWATLIASVLNALIMLGWMLRPALDRQYHTRRTARFSRRRTADLLRVGLPAGMQFCFDILSWTVFTTLLVGRFGTVELAANNLVFKCLELSFMPAVGLGVALTSVVGKAIGQGDHAKARQATRWGVCMGTLWMGLIGVVYLFFGRELAGLLAAPTAADPTLDPAAVIDWAVKLFYFCAVFQVFDALGLLHIFALRGAGDNHWVAIVFGLYASLLFLGGAFGVAHYFPHWRSLGPWGVGTIYIIALGLTMWARWKHGPWHRIDLIQARTQPEPPTTA